MHNKFLQIIEEVPAPESHSHIPSRRKKPCRALHYFQKGWDLWLRLTGPDAQQFDKSIEDQERLRRSRLLSSLIPLILIAICVFIPTAFSRPEDWFPIGTIGLFSLAIALFNRQGKVTAAGLLYTLAIDIGVVVDAVAQPHGITNSNIPDFDIFALAILLTGLILKRSFIPIIALLQLIAGFMLFSIIPHDPLLTQEIQLHLNGHAYAYLEDFFLLEVSGAILAWTSSKSFTKALERADRAEELDQLVQQQFLLLDEVKRLYQEKTLASETDAITNLLNHRAIMRTLTEHISYCHEDKDCIGLLFIDLDHFKSINDTWGHRAGDMVLLETGKRLQKAVPEDAFVGRYGGEEFAILLNNVDILSAAKIAENIKTAITALPYIWLNEDTQQEILLMVTGSIGVAVYGLHGTSAEMMLEHADQAMYSAKEQGRNRVCIAEVDSITNQKEFIENENAARAESGYADTVVVRP